MQEELKQIETEGLTDLETVTDLRELESLRIKYFGRKGLLSTVMRGMGKLSKEERPVVGKLANEVRASLTAAFDQVERTAEPTSARRTTCSGGCGYYTARSPTAVGEKASGDTNL